MRSDRHYWATLNYVHHNPVRHGYVGAGRIGRGAARRNIWPKQARARRSASGVDYPLHEYGKNWDEPEM